MKAEEKDEVLRGLRESFNGSILPINEPISNAGGDYSDPEYDVIDSFFRGREWHTLTAQELLYFQSLLWAFSDRAFAYFLPAFIFAYFDEEFGEHFDPYLLPTLVPGSYSSIDAFEKRLSFVNPEQREAIRNVLIFLLENLPSRFYGLESKGICKYWSLDCTGLAEWLAHKFEADT